MMTFHGEFLSYESMSLNHLMLKLAKPDALSILQLKTLVRFWQILRASGLKTG